MAKLPTVTVKTVAERAAVDAAELTDHMKQFLLARVSTGSDADAAKMIHVQPDTVVTWKRRSDAFVRAYQAIKDMMNERVEAIANFNREEFIEENLVDPAFLRIQEILNIEINKFSDAATIAQVRQAAVSILKAQGYLKEDAEGGLSIPVIIHNHLEGGQAGYKPRFKRVGTVEVNQPGDVPDLAETE